MLKKVPSVYGLVQGKPEQLGNVHPTTNAFGLIEAIQCAASQLVNRNNVSFPFQPLSRIFPNNDTQTTILSFWQLTFASN
jgi:hypothetical protein